MNSLSLIFPSRTGARDEGRNEVRGRGDGGSCSGGRPAHSRGLRCAPWGACRQHVPPQAPPSHPARTPLTLPEVELAIQLGEDLQPALAAVSLDLTARDVQARLKVRGRCPLGLRAPVAPGVGRHACMPHAPLAPAAFCGSMAAQPFVGAWPHSQPQPRPQPQPQP